MSAPGRNDPCPCGSGLKYKKCCLGKEAASPAVFTPAERQSALEHLFRFSRRPELEPAHAAAHGDFWTGWMARRSEDELKEAMRLEQSGTAYLEWFVFDFGLPSGRTVTEEFLARERGRLRSGEIRYLERMRLTHWRLYEVARVRHEEGLDLVDLWTRERLRVQERLATRQLIQWDLVAARVVLGPAGVPVLDGVPYLYPAIAREDVLTRLRRAHRRFKRGLPTGDLAAFFKSHGMLFHHLWLDHVALRPLPSLVTAEGDQLLLARVVFDVIDREALGAALAGRPDLERQDDGSYVWLEDTGEFRRGLGTFAPKGDRLVLEAISRERAERGRAMIEALARGSVRHRATAFEDASQALKRPHPRAPEPSDVPPEVQAEVVGSFYEQHYRKWVDTALPALAGRTPREAARLKSVRPKLIALLKGMENAAERQRREGRPAYDFTWMWEELGLPRPG
ncbi:MAG TPA: SEC-C domain-containing protein [Candidatus Acidoferrum sp.]|nr:SEC-C domain-containing protein [Candidatus Acidoferrum sp.]